MARCGERRRATIVTADPQAGLLLDHTDPIQVKVAKGPIGELVSGSFQYAITARNPVAERFAGGTGEEARGAAWHLAPTEIAPRIRALLAANPARCETLANGMIELVFPSVQQEFAIDPRSEER